MKSSKCLFSKTLFISDIKRFLPFAVPLLLAEIIIFPVVAYNTFDKKSPASIDEFAPLGIASDVCAFFFAGAMALLVFSYLFNANKCNALHAFPIGRRAHFVTHYVSGLTLLTVPQLLGLALALPVLLRYNDDLKGTMAFILASILCGSVTYYSVAVLAAMLSGNLFAGAVTNLLLNFGYVAFTSLFQLGTMEFGYGLGDDFEVLFEGRHAMTVLSPPVELTIGRVRLMELYGELLGEQHTEIAAFVKEALLYVLAAAVITGIAYLLYRRRALECAGDMTAFKPEIPLFSVLVSVLGGFYFTAFLMLMLDFEKATAFVCYGIFSFLFFFAAQMILKKSPKVFGIKPLVLWGLTCALSIGIILTAAAWRTDYIPKAADVKSVTVSTEYDIELTDKADIEAAQKLQRMLIAGEKRKDRDEYQRTYSVEYTYTVKNGSEVTRYYEVAEKDADIAGALDSLQLKNPPQSVFTALRDIDFTVTGVTVAQEAQNSETDSIEYNEFSLPTDAWNTFYRHCQADVEQMLKGYTSSKGYAVDTVNDCRATITVRAKTAADSDKLSDVAYANNGADGVGLYREDDIAKRTYVIQVNLLPKGCKTEKMLRRYVAQSTAETQVSR